MLLFLLMCYLVYTWKSSYMICSVSLMVYSDFLFLLESHTSQFCCLYLEWVQDLNSGPFFHRYLKPKLLDSIELLKILLPTYSPHAQASPCYMAEKVLVCVLTNLPLNFLWHVEISLCFLRAWISKCVFKIWVIFYLVFSGVCSRKVSPPVGSIKVPEFLYYVFCPLSQYHTFLNSLPLVSSGCYIIIKS